MSNSHISAKTLDTDTILQIFADTSEHTQQGDKEGYCIVREHHALAITRKLFTAMEGVNIATAQPAAEVIETDCRSEEGVTVGLIDALIAICRPLATRDLATPATCAALEDLRSDSDALAIFLGLPPAADEALAELSALKAHPEAYQFDGQVLRDEHGNYLAEFMAYEQSFIDRLLHPQPELKAQQVGQEPQRCQCCGYLVTESEHRGCLRAAAPQPAPSQDVAGVLEPGKIVVSAEPLRRVLNALVNAPHRIRELQVTREPVELFANNPINILIAEFEAAHDKQSGVGRE